MDPGVAQRELTRALDKLKTGNARAPELSVHILDWLREAWIMTSLNYQSFKIRTGHLFAALNERIRHTAAASDRRLPPMFEKIPAEQLVQAICPPSARERARINMR